MENLRTLNYTTALNLLKQSEQLLNTANVPQDIQENERAKLLALTYNNLGCLYKKHKQAIFYAENCLSKAEQVLKKLEKSNFFPSPDSGSDNTEQVQRESYIRNVHTTMAIALYNLGVEHEYLNEYQKSIENFNRALYITQDILDKDPRMTKIIQDGLQSVLIKQQKKFLANNHLNQQNQNTSPGRLMIDMNSSRFQPVENKKSLLEQSKLFMTRKDNLDSSIMTGSSSQLTSTLRDQISFAYGTQTDLIKSSQTRIIQGNAAISNLRNSKLNQTKLVFTQQERKAQSNLRGQNLSSPSKQSIYGLDDRNIIRRGGGNPNPLAQQFSKSQHKHHNILNKINQEFSLPTIQNQNRSFVQREKSTGDSNSRAESTLQNYSGQFDILATSTLKQQQSIQKQMQFYNQVAQNNFNSRSALSQSNNATTNFGSKKSSVSRQFNNSKISPIRSYQGLSTQSQNNLNSTYQNIREQRQEVQSEIFNPAKTSFTFGGDKEPSKPVTEQYERKIRILEDDGSQATVQKAITNISTKLVDLEARLKNYKIQTEMILEQEDQEISLRNPQAQSTYRSDNNLRQQKTKVSKIEAAFKLEDDNSVHFDQLSCVSGDSRQLI